MANQNGDNIDVGLNLSGNALGTVQQLTQNMLQLRTAANSVGDMLKNINTEYAALNTKAAATKNLPNNKTLKTFRQQSDMLSITPDVLDRMVQQQISRANQAARINELVKSPQNFNNQNTMTSVLNNYDPRQVKKALEVRLDTAQLNGNIKKAQEAQQALSLYQSTLADMNTKLKGVVVTKRLQDQATLEFLNQPVSQMSISQNAFGKLNRGYASAGNEKQIREYMAKPSNIKPVKDPYKSTQDYASTQRALEINASKMEAAQRLIGQNVLGETTSASKRQLAQQTEMLGKLEEEKIKLQAIANLRRANIKNTDSELAAIRNVGTAREKNLRLEENLNVLRKNQTLNTKAVTSLAPDALLVREAETIKNLSSAKSAMHQADTLGNAKAKKESSELLIYYQRELDAIRKRNKELQPTSNNTQIKRLQENAQLEFLSQPLSKMAISQNAYAQLNRGYVTAAKEQQIRGYMADPTTLKPLKDPYRTAGDYASSQRALEMNASKLEAAQRLKGETALANADGSNQKRLNQLSQVVGLLEAERVKLQSINTLNRANLKTNDAELKALRDAGTAREKNLRLEETLRGNLRTPTLSSERIAKLSPENLILREAAMVDRLSRARKAMHQADALGNAKAKKDSSELVVAYQQELDAIRKRNKEMKASTRNTTADRFRDLSSGESSGALLGIQGILMRNYMLWGGLIGAITGSYTFLRDYELALKQTQAISQATATQTADLSNSILTVAENSRFSAIEITEAATTLAQAGFSVAEIKTTLESVTLLATATGSTLKETVDIATASLGAFQLSAENMPRIVNQITQAMNLSKLDIQKFQLAVQYAGNAASDAGLNFEELLSSVSTVANAGVRSGSTLGTGFRQLLSDFIAPSAKFQGILERLGLTAADVDVRTKGLVGALKTLREAGFTTADAYQSFEVRSVAFYTALSNNLSTYDSINANLDNNTAAMDANEVQMDSLAAQTDRMNNQFKALAETAGAGVREALKDIFNVVGSLAGAFRDVLNNQIASSTIQLITMTAALTGGIYLVRGMMGAFTGLVTVLGTLKTSMAGVGAITALTLPHFVAIAAAVSGAILLFQHLTKNLGALKIAMELSKTTLNEFKDNTTKLGTEIQETDKKIVSLESRFEALKDDPVAVAIEMNNLKNRASELGIALKTDLVDGIESVRAGWEELRITLAKELVTNLDAQIAEIQNLALITSQMNAKSLLESGDPTNIKTAREKGYNKGYDLQTLEEISSGTSTRDSQKTALSGSNRRGESLDPFFSAISQANKAAGGVGDSAAIKRLSDKVYQSAIDVQGMSKDQLEKELPAIAETFNSFMTILNQSRREYQKKSSDSNLNGVQRGRAKEMVEAINAYAATFKTINASIQQQASLVKEQNMVQNTRASTDASVKINEDLKNARKNGTIDSALGNKAAYGNASSLIKPTGKEGLNLQQRDRLKEVMPFIKEAAAKTGVPEDLIIGQMITESSLSPNKSILGKNADGSNTSAVGLLQVTKAAAKDAGYNYSDITSNDKNNILAGATYLAKVKDQVGGNWEDAIRAYYMGPTGFKNYKANGSGSKRYGESTAYARKVFTNQYAQQQTGGRYNIVGEIDLPENTKQILGDVAYLKQKLSEYSGLYAKQYGTGDIGKLPPEQQAQAKTMAAYISQLQTEINTKADQSNNTIRAAQAEDQAHRKQQQEENKVIIATIQGEVVKAEAKLKELKGEEKTTPTGEYIKKVNAAFDKLKEVKKDLLSAETNDSLLGSATYDGKNLVLPDYMSALADMKLKSDTEKLDSEIDQNRREALETIGKNLAKRITDQNDLFIDTVKTQLVNASDDFNQAMSAADFQSKLDLWQAEDDANLVGLKAQRATMDDPRYKDNYSGVQREALTREIDKTGLEALAFAKNNKLILDKRLMEARVSQLTKDLDGLKVEQKEIELDLTLEASKIQDETLRKETVAAIEKKQIQLSKELTKNGDELVKLQTDLRVIDAQIKEGSGEYQAKPYGLGKEITTITGKLVTDQETADGYSSSIQTAIGGINGAFNELITNAMSASDNIDDFFKILTGGAKESKEAFKAFGYSIVQTIAKVLQDRLVNQFVDFLATTLLGKDGESGFAKGLNKVMGTASGKTVGQKEVNNSGGSNGWLETGLRLVGSYFGGKMSAGAISGPSSFAGIGDNSYGTYGMFDSPQYRSEGGLLRGSGAANVDNIPVMASDMEYMLPSSVTEAVGLGALERLRQDPKGFMDSKINIGGKSEGPARPPSNTNVYVVSPQNVPKTTSKNDIIVTITDDITRNGQLKSLIKQIVNE